MQTNKIKVINTVSYYVAKILKNYSHVAVVGQLGVAVLMTLSAAVLALECLKRISQNII